MEPPEDETDPDTLLNVYRESLKVHLSHVVEFRC